ncbi:MAG: nitroreductase family protein [Clostridiales bacterium]|nr:nitroreductase family protein [Clostridiales bacterium]
MEGEKIFATLFLLFLISVPLNSCAIVFASENNVNVSFSIEEVISRRMSIRSFDLDKTVSSETVSTILWAAYGYSWQGRTVASISDFPIIIYVANQTGTYRFSSENQNLVLWKEGDYRDLASTYEAPVQLYLILDKDICSSISWGNAEAGFVIQNIYLISNGLNLGCVCQFPNRGLIDDGLELPSNEMTLYKIPIGYPATPYENYDNLTPVTPPSSQELPMIQDTTITIIDALDSFYQSTEWSETSLSSQQLSQILWAGYGYSYYADGTKTPIESHRTVPSAHAHYPLRIFVAEKSGVYRYNPEQHTLTKISSEDKRTEIAQNSGSSEMLSAPTVIVLAYEENTAAQYPPGGDETYTELGLVTQNIMLEGFVWGLTGNWDKVDNREGLKETLGISEPDIHPLSIIGIGNPSMYRFRTTWDEVTYTVEIESDLAIVDFDFNQLHKEISFNVISPIGESGDISVQIPNNLMDGNFSIRINGMELEESEYSIATNSNQNKIEIINVNESGFIEIQATKVIPEFSPIIIVPALGIFTAIVIISKNKLKNEEST